PSDPSPSDKSGYGNRASPSAPPSAGTGQDQDDGDQDDHPSAPGADRGGRLRCEDHDPCSLIRSVSTWSRSFMNSSGDGTQSCRATIAVITTSASSSATSSSVWIYPFRLLAPMVPMYAWLTSPTSSASFISRYTGPYAPAWTGLLVEIFS